MHHLIKHTPPPLPKLQKPMNFSFKKDKLYYMIQSYTSDSKENPITTFKSILAKAVEMPKPMRIKKVCKKRKKPDSQARTPSETAKPIKVKPIYKPLNITCTTPSFTLKKSFPRPHQRTYSLQGKQVPSSDKFSPCMHNQRNSKQFLY